MVCKNVMLVGVEVVVFSVQISRLAEGAKGIATRSGKASRLSHQPHERTDVLLSLRLINSQP